MWWREPLLNFFVETRHKLWGPVEACSTFIWKVECILFLIEWLNWCCTLYFRPSVKSASFTCKWYSSVTHMGSSYLTWHFTSCKGNCCHGAIKNITFAWKIDTRWKGEFLLIPKAVRILHCGSLRWTTHELVLVIGSFKNIVWQEILLTVLSWKQPGNINKCLTFSARVYVVCCDLNLNISVCNYFVRNSSKLETRFLIGLEWSEVWIWTAELR